MYQRTYFDKDNVIIKNSNINLGSNPVAELFYGGQIKDTSFSRYIFHFNEFKLKSLYNQCYLGDLTKTKHTLKFKKTWFFGKNEERCLASTYKICLFKINQDWTEGCGYSYECQGGCESLIKEQCNVNFSASNWYNATPELKWSNEGVFNSETSSYLQCQTIDCNECDLLEFDVTDEVNKILKGEIDNHGFGLTLHYDYENEITPVAKYIGIYSRETSTFFKPFLETEYLNEINDSRYDFEVNSHNKIYLETRKNGNYISLDNTPTIEIKSNDNVIINLDSKCVSKGIYETELNVNGEINPTCKLLSDNWNDLNYEGNSMPTYIDYIELKENLIQFNKDNSNVKEYNVKIRGLNDNRVFKGSNLIKIFADVYLKYTVKQKYKPEGVFYKVYLKEGCCNEHVIINWTPFNYLNCQHWFYLDTEWMINQEYFIDVKIIDNDMETTLNEVKKITIRNNKIC